MKLGHMIKQVADSWSTYHISTLAAALSYYTLFSLTPILIISLYLLVFFLNEEFVRHELLNDIKELFGGDTSKQIQLMMESANKPRTGIWAQLIGVIVLIIGSSALFSEIQNGLNRIWEVKINPKQQWFNFIKNQLLSFFMVLMVALLLFFSFMLSVGLTAMTPYISRFLNIGFFEIIFLHLISFFIVVLLFAMIFKILPDVTIQWRKVWVGALITTFLFTVGKYILGIYFSRLPIASLYGAASSIIILLIWVYYSAQIFFIGAIITKVIAQTEKTRKPKQHAHKHPRTIDLQSEKK